MRVLIVDDEAPARRKLLRMLSSEPDVEIVGEAADGAAAVEAIGTERPDLVFLDVRMPGLDGFGVIHEVGVAAMPHVVFVTAYDEYALKAFEVQALDYVLKPVSPSRFRAVLDRARERFRLGRASDLAESLSTLLEQVRGRTPFLDRVMVEKNGRGFFLPVDTVDRVEAARNYVRLYAAGASYVVRQSIGTLAERLDPAKFLRISRSDVVRIDAVKEFQTWFHGDYKVILKDGTELMWSRRYRSKVPSELSLE